ncbi:hypothetical protein EVAR_58190_1 [Eumeta japonica]|uniref:Uncharacterized protein n=1 Tax=Eumeta variegata TaxID=151549 RepID=A0A4C1YT90_EUMVA|nr:hypothetical protein EVAR_58190_1 [Eumeta japonica]
MSICSIDFIERTSAKGRFGRAPVAPEGGGARCGTFEGSGEIRNERAYEPPESRRSPPPIATATESYHKVVQGIDTECYDSSSTCVPATHNTPQKNEIAVQPGRGQAAARTAPPGAGADAAP